jgi:hypothetical protein
MMKKIIMIFVLSMLMFSCGERQDVVFDNINGQALAYFKNNTIDLKIVLNSTGSVDVNFGVTTISTQDRTVTISIVGDETDAPSTLYSLSSTTAVIPANSYNGSLTVNGVYDPIIDDAVKTLTLKLDSVDGGIVKTEFLRVNIKITCPIPDDYLVGTYLIEQTSALVDGFTLDSGAIVEVTQDGGAGSTVRSFPTINYPTYCNSVMNFKFDLFCGEISIPSQNSTCSCGNATDWFGPPVTNSTYDLDDDTVVFITFKDDQQNDCNTITDTTYKLTKQ